MDAIERLRTEFGAVEGPNKALIARKNGFAHMVAYWDAHAGVHRVSDGGTVMLEAAPEVVEEVKPASAPKLGLPGKK